MALRQVQAVLARLYTDRAFRAKFFANPQAACDIDSLTEQERRQLAQLDRRQVERYARSLQRKRIDGARALLPASAKLLRDTFDARFYAYCDARRSAGERVVEAVDFASFLLDSVQIENRLARDVVACERMLLEVVHAVVEEAKVSATVTLDSQPQLTMSARVLECGYDLEALYHRLLRGERAEFAAKPSTILVGKVRGEPRAKLKRINRATAELLTQCDGVRKTGTIVEYVAAHLRLDDAEKRSFATECLELLSSLHNSGLLRLR